jgi:hypothetical protein
MSKDRKKHIKMSEDRKKYIRERNEALLSFDKDRINKFFAKHGSGSGEYLDDETFWIGVHMAITASTSIPDNLRKRSAKWLTDRGYSHFYNVYH